MKRPRGFRHRRTYQCNVCLGDVHLYPGEVVDKSGIRCEKCQADQEHKDSMRRFAALYNISIEDMERRDAQANQISDLAGNWFTAEFIGPGPSRLQPGVRYAGMALWRGWFHIPALGIQEHLWFLDKFEPIPTPSDHSSTGA